MMRRNLKLEPILTVAHCEIIDSTHWLHQVTKFTFHSSEIKALKTERIAKTLNLSINNFIKLKSGQILICTTFGYIVGVVRDSPENFRVITFP